MCEFQIILHIVSLSVVITFTLALVAQPFAVLFAHKVIALIRDEFGFLVLWSGKNVTSKDARTSLYDYPRRLAIMLRSARHRTWQKKKNYLYYMEDTMAAFLKLFSSGDHFH